MKFLIAVPDSQYYLWQVLVQINNFRKMGIEQDTIYLIGMFNNRPSKELILMLNSKEIKAKFYLIPDTRTNKTYTSSLRPHMIEKFYSMSKIKDNVIFYLDPDVIFTKQIDFSKFENDNTWYVSDTKSYIDSKYIKSKSPELFKKMCEIVEISPDFITAHDDNAGGAQYIMKNTDTKFWNKVYWDSEQLYNLMKSTANIYNPNHPIQAWTADMWAVLWNGWYYNHDIQISDELAFCWASDSASKWNEKNIFHNAGVVLNDGKHFSKIHYQNSPFNKDLKENSESCSYNYIKEIKETEVNFPNLLF